jgi:hypothetical protein
VLFSIGYQVSVNLDSPFSKSKNYAGYVIAACLIYPSIFPLLQMSRPTNPHSQPLKPKARVIYSSGFDLPDPITITMKHLLPQSFPVPPAVLCLLLTACSLGQIGTDLGLGNRAIADNNSRYGAVEPPWNAEIFDRSDRALTADQLTEIMFLDYSQGQTSRAIRNRYGIPTHSSANADYYRMGNGSYMRFNYRPDGKAYSYRLGE